MGFIENQSSNIPGNSLESYKQSFDYHEGKIFHLIFERHKHLIKAKKVETAANNLKKIFAATFKLSSKIGFNEMSLRDLSTETGISMGGLYSCLGKKEDIAHIVLDVVEMVTTKTNQTALEEPNELVALEIAIKHHLYSSTLLHPWFFFLYFETRCLSESDQKRSKQIELSTIQTLESIIQKGVKRKVVNVDHVYFTAHTIVTVLQDWYLKPWKQKQNTISLEDYSSYLFNMIQKLLKLDVIKS